MILLIDNIGVVLSAIEESDKLKLFFKTVLYRVKLLQVLEVIRYTKASSFSDLWVVNEKIS